MPIRLTMNLETTLHGMSILVAIGTVLSGTVAFTILAAFTAAVLGFIEDRKRRIRIADDNMSND